MSHPVIHDNDGHVDDLLSTIMLWLAPQVDLQAVTLTEGDCYVQQAFEALLKMATYLDLEGAEIGYSETPCPNPFPDNWRRESYVVNELPIFGENALKKLYQNGKARRSEQVIADTLSHSKAPVTFVTTGPLTNVSPIFEKRPELKDKVAEFVVMGGAVNVKGNVDQPEHDGTAEWNFYADPPAAKALLETGIPVRLIALDVTNQAPVTKEFLERLDAQADRHRASRLASKIYSLIKGFNYYFWDTLTAAYVMKPELFEFKDMKIDIAAGGKSAGRTAPSGFFGGRKVKVATSLDVPAFEDLVLETFRLK